MHFLSVLLWLKDKQLKSVSWSQGDTILILCGLQNKFDKSSINENFNQDQGLS